MNFCDNCNNRLHFMTEENIRSLYCKNCNYKRDISELDSNNTLVYERYVKQQPLHYEFVINNHTKNDPTLPKSSFIVCPNTECNSNKKPEDGGVKREVTYIKHDPESMKYIYICTVCDTKWNSTY